MLTKIRPFLLFVTFLLVFLPLQSTADVYKCPGKGGKITFQDRPCKGSKGKTIALKQNNHVDTQTQRRMQDIKQAADKATQRADKQSAERLAIQQQKRLEADLLCKKYLKEQEYWDTQQRLARETKDKQHFYGKELQAGGSALFYCGKKRYY